MVDFQPPRGTRDFGPKEMARRRMVEGAMREVIESYGYREVSTPTFEAAELFISRSGPQVVEQMYLFKDKGGRDMVLRPELTAPVMRFYSSSLKNMPKPLRIYYFGNCFRYERPQKGRFREFWQLGLEYIGKRTPQAHAEVILAAWSALKRVGLNEARFRIGHVKLLKGVLQGAGMDPEKDKDLLTAIDKKDMDGIRERLSGLDGATKEKLISLMTNLCPLWEAKEVLDGIKSSAQSDLSEAIGELMAVLPLLENMGGSVLFDPSIIRGLDYYDGIVFEADAPSLGAEKQVCGGGAYSLSSLFGPEVEGIGFGLGFDRILVAIPEGPTDGSHGKGIYIIPLGKDAMSLAFSVADSLRNRGARCIMETMERPLRKAISSAVDAGMDDLLIIGEEEVRSGTITYKDLRTQVQRTLKIKEAVSLVEERP